ncbi:MAG: hypothetical protein KME15_01765 [Drouetiella hepatica Uher 2000/2452]|uniref:Uncharacterized protein n=1 Tax=Drouetiella hepatica Uher 2000/2452 TaxID=904376 RepID=A0A951Q6S0_9CYAN|nr:hypothetical protein [Drouetiella hepatica Uher 2000/2452]
MTDNFNRSAEPTPEELAAIESDLAVNLDSGDRVSLSDSDTDESIELQDVPTDLVGDQAIGGTAPTPDQDLVDEMGAAVGIEMDDRAFLRTTEILESRDDRRWELEPDSAEEEHRNRQGG